MKHRWKDVFLLLYFWYNEQSAEGADAEKIELVEVLIEQTFADYPHLLLNQSLNDGLLADVTAVPTTFFFDKEGKLLDTVVGAKGKSDRKEIIDGFLKKCIYNYFGGCDCKWCNGKPAIEIGTGDKGVQLHHWQMMIEEVNNFNQYDGEERIIYLRDRIDTALKNLDSVPKEIMGSQKNTDYYKLLKNLKKIV